MSLTQQDIVSIEEIFDKKLDERFPNLNQRLDKIMEVLDSIVGQLRDMQEEMTTLAHRSSDHEDRLGKIEEIHPGGHH